MRDVDAERLGFAPSQIRLFADSDATGGALSAQRAILGEGSTGAAPPPHPLVGDVLRDRGSLQVLAGERTATVHEGDLVVVPPYMAHAFAAPPGATADVLIVITPGVERFEYFRLVDKLARGEATVGELLATQERFDNHFADSPVWRELRGGGGWGSAGQAATDGDLG
ncbi:cupin [Streptomyces sp. M19]